MKFDKVRYVNEDQTQNFRRLALAAWIKANGGARQACVKKGLGKSVESHISQILRGYSFGARAARNLELKLGIPHRLLDQVSRGERVIQPRLKHRYQVDRHGLAVSVHRLEGEGDSVRFSLNPQGSPLAQVLGAIYAVERLTLEARRALNPSLHKAMRWRRS